MDSGQRLDLNLLRILVALLDQGSASEAAIALGISQPSVSGALAKLRRHFDDELFVRAPGGMAPTPRGVELACSARELLRQIDEQLRSQPRFDPLAKHRPFTFALSDVGEIVFLPKLIRFLAQTAPGTAVRSVILKPSALAEALESGDVDLAIGYFPDLRSAAFFQQLLFTHHFVCLLRADHAVQGSRMTMGEFVSLDHAVVHSESRSQEIFERYLESRGVKRRIAVVTPHFLSIPKLIASSNMVVAVPHAVGIEYGNSKHRLKVIDPPFVSPRIDLRQHWHRRLHHDPRSVWLRRIVSQLFNAATDEWGRAPAAADQPQSLAMGL